MSAPKIFTPEYYARMRDNESGGWWNAAMRDAAGRLLDVAGLPATGRLLDVGCGSGQTMGWFAAGHPGWDTRGIDVSPDAVGAAGRGWPGRIARASALALPFGDASVDLVITLDVVQHLPIDDGDRRGLQEIRRVIRPGGWLLLRTNAQAFPRTPDDPVHAFRRYEPADLRAKLTGTGFVIHRMGRLNALLGLAEIPREWRARRSEASGYHGLMTTPRSDARWAFALKRAWLGQEGRLVAYGLSLPLGRAILALCQVPGSARTR